MTGQFEPAKRVTLSGGLAALLLAACHKPAQTAQSAPALAPPTTTPPTPAVTEFCAATAALGEALLSALRSHAPTSTVVISPLSVISVMAMLAQGARGATLAELRRGLHFQPSGLGIGDVADAYEALSARLVASPFAAVALANGLWVDTRLELKPAFARAQSAKFAARVDSLDLSGPEAPTVINRFVADATGGKISNLVEGLPAEPQMVAVSALYFKGAWSNTFDLKDTRVLPFTRGDGGVVQAPLMRQTGEFGYVETKHLQSVSLPYKDERFELVLVLQKKTASHQPIDWTKALPTTREGRPGEVIFPRMNLLWRADLKDPLAHLGLANALGSSADYGDVAVRPITVSQVIHEVALVVDEQGSEAAAATVEADAAADIPEAPPKPFSFRADRPFYLALRDVQTGAPLFMAYVADPTAT